MLINLHLTSGSGRLAAFGLSILFADLNTLDWDDIL